MADVTNFMSEGQEIPVGSALTDMTKQTILPDWYSNYAMDILANQKAVAAKPFQEYVDASGRPIPRVADFSPDQQQAFGATRQGAFAFRPELSTAASRTQDVFGRSTVGAAQPYFSQATAINPALSAEPGLQQAAGYVTGSTAPTGINMAQPYLAQAGQTAAQTVGQYMNPYTEQVVNRIGALGARTLQEQLIPAIQSQMISAGQFGGTRQAELMGRALRDTMEGVSAQQAQALQQGYGQGLEAAATDLSRQGQLASTAGNLGAGQQQALLNAGARMADIGTAYGGLSQAQQQLLADIGSKTGTMYGQDTGNLMAGAGQMAELAKQRQAMELAGAGALEAVGAQQQGLAQKNLDIAYQDEMRRQAYPQQQISQMAETMKNVYTGIPTAVQEYGIQPVSYQPKYPSSTASDIATGLTGAAGLVKALKEEGVI